MLITPRDTPLAIDDRYLGELQRLPIKAWIRRRRREPSAMRGGSKSYPQVNQTAILGLYGILFQRPHPLHQWFGGISTQEFEMMLDQAIHDSSVEEIVIDVDSPGGSVFGVAEAADHLFQARHRKKITAVVNSMMASAAYWIASAASQIVMTPSGMAGSIGVVVAHEDIAEAEKKAGIKTTLIYSGKYKVDGNPFESLGDHARAQLQSECDYYYTMFVNAVARHRGASPAAVRPNYGEGRMLTATPAKAAGLVDRIATLDQVVSETLAPAGDRQRLALAQMRQHQLELDAEDLLEDRRRAWRDF